MAAAIQSALRLVTEASVPDDLRAVVFGKAFDALTGGYSVVDASERSPGSAPAQLPAGETALERAARRLRLDPGTVERVLDFDPEGVFITVPRSRFPIQKSSAIQQVATIIAAARQAAELEEWTPQAVVRGATEELGVHDPSNFATHLKRLNGARLRGSGRFGELKLNAVGFENAANLIRRLAQEVPP